MFQIWNFALSSKPDFHDTFFHIDHFSTVIPRWVACRKTAIIYIRLGIIFVITCRIGVNCSIVCWRSVFWNCKFCMADDFIWRIIDWSCFPHTSWEISRFFISLVLSFKHQFKSILFQEIHCRIHLLLYSSFFINFYPSWNTNYLFR